ncbi:DUF3349 domain-containing protein [Sorangium sp. So ce362]|uniref:DUF3349 domain-containing protein n=1 Tax=Sorangium sp. So ce362 TaxID=3133303 RepID=UPI003F6426CD
MKGAKARGVVFPAFIHRPISLRGKQEEAIMTVPDHLRDTFALLLRAFPDGVAEDEYMPLLAVLARYLCDENVVIVAAELTGKNRGIVLNDVYAAQEHSETIDVDRVVRRLETVGFREWLSKEE